MTKLTVRSSIERRLHTVLVVFFVICSLGQAASAQVLINEVDADQVSTDSAEFVELFDGGAGNTDLSGMVLVLFNGSDDASYLAFDLDGQSTNSSGYFVLCGNAANTANCDLDVSPNTNLIQNGADAVALLTGDASAFPNDTPVTTTNLIDAIVYDTDDGDDAGLLVLLNPGQPQVNERGGGDGTGHSNQRCPNGAGGARNTAAYTQADPTPGAANDCPPPPTAGFIINEVDADQSSTDSAEFVEIYDGGDGNSDLSGHVLVLFNGSDDQSYLAFDLDGQSTNSSGYFVLCGNAANTANCDLDVSPDTNLIQNGEDAVALLLGDAVDYPNDTALPPDGDIVDAIVYETGSDTNSGLLVLLNSGQNVVNEGGGGNQTGHSNQRCLNGSGGARNTDTYVQADPTPGETNACGSPVTLERIHTVQGSGAASPLVGNTVAIEGIVVGDFQNGASGTHGDLNGFFVQEEDTDADGNPLTSEGIFVFDGSSSSSPAVDVAIGDAVRVEGVVSEFGGLTEITSFSGVSVSSSGNPLPTAATPTLPVTSVDDFEAFEGMRVTFSQALVISEYFNFDRFGEIVLTSERHLTFTAEFEPGPASIPAAQTFLLDSITLDDGRTSQNPDPAIHPNGMDFDLTNLFRGGDTVQDVTGVMSFAFGSYRIQPTQGANYSNDNPRTLQPDSVGGNLKVASFNVLNYFSTLDEGATRFTCGPSQDQGCRGADNATEFTRQRDKIIAALTDIDADVVGLLEIENNIDDDAVQDLISGLNAANGAGTYDSVSTGTIGTDAIKVALIYKPASVSLVGGHAILDSSVDSRFIDTKNRPVLAQTFMDSSTGGVFTVAVNHLKSKGSNCNDLGDPDTGDGSGNCNLTRQAAAEALVDWLAGDPTASGDDDFLIIGDLNSYDKEDPIDSILAGGYTDLIHAFRGEDAYSFVFDGQTGYLDYALSNASLSNDVTGVAEWHINADEPDLIDYDTSFKGPNQDAIYAPDAYRSSDHDPVIVGLDVCDEIAPSFDEVSVSLDVLWPANHKYVDVEATVVASDNFDPNPIIALVSATSNEPDNGTGDGNTVQDIVVVNDFLFKLRAERSGTGNGRIYSITYSVTDVCGNSATATTTVSVPHSKGR